MNKISNKYYYRSILDSYVRGRFDGSCYEGLQSYQQNAIRMFHFKRKQLNDRQQVSLNLLKSLSHGSFLMVGPGRGTMLYPLMDTVNSKITAIDNDPDVINELMHIIYGRLFSNFTCKYEDVCWMGYKDDSFDTVVALEVLEHVKDYRQAVDEIRRVSKKHIVISVPSKEDHNPEHINLFTKEELEELFSGCKIKFIDVKDHYLLLVTKV